MRSCGGLGKAEGRKISPRSQRRDDQRPEQAKRARPGEARHGVECLARMSGVGRREADASGGYPPGEVEEKGLERERKKTRGRGFYILFLSKGGAVGPSFLFFSVGYA